MSMNALKMFLYGDKKGDANLLIMSGFLLLVAEKLSERSAKAR